MPRYFFDVIDGHRLSDPAGLECRDDAEATAYARTIARQIATDAPTSSRRHIVVINDNRQEVGAVPVAAETQRAAGRKI
jgi:stage III sporulation protein SpoIIIAA